MLGDSIAHGQGASRPADTVGARLVADLAAAGIAAELHVFAMPRACSSALAAQVERALARRADVVVIIVGANDLTSFVSPQVAASQLSGALQTLRRAGVHVVVVPAPDLSVVPWVPEQVRRIVGAACAVLQRAQIRVAHAAGARVADVAAASSRFAADASLFSADRFHPSSAGYALIAAQLAPAVRAAAADALQS
jgi:lysophospholipase L1-like esterase